jgi:hypothetical protein
MAQHLFTVAQVSLLFDGWHDTVLIRAAARAAMTAAAVIVALALLAVGAYALFGALDTQANPDAAGAASAQASSTHSPRSPGSTA